MTRETLSDPTPTGQARERLLDAAEALIYAGGIHATGVDAIVRQSGTARKSFYTHFESKDALVAAALERRDERWMNWFIAGTQRRGKTARKRLLGMFDVLREWFASADFHGCAFLNAAGEIASADDPIRIVARQHKERLLDFVRTECAAFSAESAMDTRRVARLARQWLVLLDGAIAVALVSGEADAALDAQTAAKTLLDAQAGFAAKPAANTAVKSEAKPPAKPAAKSAHAPPTQRPPSRRTAT
ncbi:TetR/AcrR family transcriptional regulator [Paraburkholderia sp. Ac-20336]|uniref:TetR/AcrR family transcriptional regulator n=1 Tax=Burkholderiaceae TaxID=119060 RepID=UPI0014221CDC|nr:MULTISPECIES: TetR/AcrR family transcriptional regulator [Burkholderiaceae]MBN3803322.1 TetR/AcrR family transcriptional regulator [Paraburkholderia sp. Ac-20336]MBN3845715.1 TetR/AcrR family transcriptional regulator [Paraburkholderia sp. Ac-20342]NIF51728.1 TetR/AcrR family transcriptional regulator [Burkholderia sp. Ax-1724]